ncbi:class II aldolase/adducin family protein [Methylohalobius crimeensis]|uniref:class II aldolase/adducin family protein n=1 Tax=Methylohalobius crimeensis TaxID=244365 RepID=UPI0003B4EB0A|nr:class II aldolase/adducin family protein [Methylohalobius crimeensis]
MLHEEGVVKYRLRFTLSAPPQWDDYPDLESWRCLLFHLGLIGQDPKRYQGLAYGNVSQRLAGDRFVISATQTGGKAHLSSEHYCLVESADPTVNQVVAKGCQPPSSEALTHASVYRASVAVRAVMHGHSPEIWRYSDRLALRATPATAEYGTPAMAEAVREQVRKQPEHGIIVMKGHPDGVIAYADTPRRAALSLIETLAKAWSLALGARY